MRAVRYATFGDPAEVLQLADVPDLHPARGQILLRVTLSPIHNHDLWTIRGSYGIRPDLPATGGSEGVGIVEAAGPEVDPALVGRRVAVAGLQGSWAEFALAPAAAAIPVPETMPDEAAAQLIAMPFSAISLLEFLNVREGDRVIQTAANGAVGKIMSVLAASRGIKILNLVRRAEAAEELAAAGNLDTLGTDDPNWLTRARDRWPRGRPRRRRLGRGRGGDRAGRSARRGWASGHLRLDDRCAVGASRGSDHLQAPDGERDSGVPR